MSKTLKEYGKFTTKELQSYAETEGSGVSRKTTDMHVCLGPYILTNIKHALNEYLIKKKVGQYDQELDAIILGVKNIKLLGREFAMRADDPKIHINLRIDCYIFRPILGTILTGIVKYIGHQHIAVVLYKVFNANLQIGGHINKNNVKMDQEMKFRIKSFNLTEFFPTIQGELLESDEKGSLKPVKDKVERKDGATDSGIEEKDFPGLDESDCKEMDDLITTIKLETMSEIDPNESIMGSPTKTKSKSKKRKSDMGPPESPLVKQKKIKKEKSLPPEEPLLSSPIKVKKEKREPESASESESPAKKKKVKNDDNANGGELKKRKRLSSITVKREIEV